MYIREVFVCFESKQSFRWINNYRAKFFACRWTIFLYRKEIFRKIFFKLINVYDDPDFLWIPWLHAYYSISDTFWFRFDFLQMKLFCNKTPIWVWMIRDPCLDARKVKMDFWDFREILRFVATACSSSSASLLT